jgi:hypothetical protein
MHVYVSKKYPAQLYIRLPESEQKPIGGAACCCGKPGCANKWDTLAVNVVPPAQQWTVHFPDLESSDTVYRVE